MTLPNRLARAAWLCCVLGMTGCDAPRLTLRQMCIQECERTGRTFETVEQCRSACREAYAPDATDVGAAPPLLQASHATSTLFSSRADCQTVASVLPGERQ